MKIAVAITGASGSVVGARLAEELKKSGAKVTTIVSDAAQKVAQTEGVSIEAQHTEHDIDAPLASSSCSLDAFIICPCSVKTLAAVAHGYANNLITRVADNCLKMRRRLVLCVRETPYSIIHINNMRTVTEAGGIVMPLNMAYYPAPQNIDDVTNFFVGKVLDILDIKHNLYKRWNP
jgi:4-hydroxy-3-polyprenylbenzoate decarboxylase